MDEKMRHSEAHVKENSGQNPMGKPLKHPTKEEIH
jgi:hypothetical protein